MRIGFRRKWGVFVLYLRRRCSLEVRIGRRIGFGIWNEGLRIRVWTSK